MKYRVGLGYDFHALEKGDYILLMGVKVPSDKKIKAHSDGDIVAHSIAQALYSAIGMEDIGTYYPPSDPSLKDMSSLLIVKNSFEEVKKRGYLVNNINVAIILQSPKLKGYKEEIKKNISEVLEIDKEDISVHAGTKENKDAIGKNEGIAVLCQVMLYKE